MNDDAFTVQSKNKYDKSKDENNDGNVSDEGDLELNGANRNVLVIPDLKRELSRMTLSKSFVNDNSSSSNSFQKEFEESLEVAYSSMHHAFLQIPSDSMLQCCIRRSSHRLPIYTMYVEKQNGDYGKILIGYTISKLPKAYIRIFAIQTSSNSEILLGKLKANISNTHFSLNCVVNASDAAVEVYYKNGSNNTDGNEKVETEEHMNIVYKDSSIFGDNKVQQFSCVTMPRKTNLNSSRFSSNSDSIFVKYANKNNDVQEKEFVSKMPKFNEKKGTKLMLFKFNITFVLINRRIHFGL